MGSLNPPPSPLPSPPPLHWPRAPLQAAPPHQLQPRPRNYSTQTLRPTFPTGAAVHPAQCTSLDLQRAAGLLQSALPAPTGVQLVLCCRCDIQLCKGLCALFTVITVIHYINKFMNEYNLYEILKNV